MFLQKAELNLVDFIQGKTPRCVPAVRKLFSYAFKCTHIDGPSFAKFYTNAQRSYLKNYKLVFSIFMKKSLIWIFLDPCYGS